MLPIGTTPVNLAGENLLVEDIRHAFVLEEPQVVLGCRRQRYLTWMWQMTFPAIADYMEFKTMIVHVLGGAVSLVGDIPCYLARAVFAAACHYSIESTRMVSS